MTFAILATYICTPMFPNSVNTKGRSLTTKPISQSEGRVKSKAISVIGYNLESQPSREFIFQIQTQTELVLVLLA